MKSVSAVLEVSHITFKRCHSLADIMRNIIHPMFRRTSLAMRGLCRGQNGQTYYAEGIHDGEAKRWKMVTAQNGGLNRRTKSHVGATHLSFKNSQNLKFLGGTEIPAIHQCVVTYCTVSTIKILNDFCTSQGPRRCLATETKVYPWFYVANLLLVGHGYGHKSLLDNKVFNLFIDLIVRRVRSSHTMNVTACPGATRITRGVKPL